jgi:pantoate--beta-alanine ligase
VQVYPDPSSFRAACDEARQKGLTVGLVPTMGALHDGHLSLLRAARKEVDFVVVSIFVNPTQFGPNEDFLRYPRPLDRDLWLLKESEAAAVLTPTPEAMYPAGDRTRVHVSGLTDGLCSPFRPGHFEGVATVVAKLLNIAGPCKAFFGRKDYQQLQVVRRSVKDLFLPATIVGVPTVREVDGLARSSRNIYLTVEQRDAALTLVTGLRAAHDAFAAGERDAAVLRNLARAPVEALATRIDYVEVADADDLTPLVSGEPVGDRALVAIAAWIGTTRLIDNVVLGEDPRP